MGSHSPGSDKGKTSSLGWLDVWFTHENEVLLTPKVGWRGQIETCEWLTDFLSWAQHAPQPELTNTPVLLALDCSPTLKWGLWQIRKKLSHETLRLVKLQTASEQVGDSHYWQLHRWYTRGSLDLWCHSDPCQILLVNMSRICGAPVQRSPSMPASFIICRKYA